MNKSFLLVVCPADPQFEVKLLLQFDSVESELVMSCVTSKTMVTIDRQ